MTLLLEPILIRTAQAIPENGVRVVWVVSILQLGSPDPAMSFDRNGTPLGKSHVLGAKRRFKMLLNQTLSSESPRNSKLTPRFSCSPKERR